MDFEVINRCSILIAIDIEMRFRGRYNLGVACVFSLKGRLEEPHSEMREDLSLPMPSEI